MTVEEQIRKNLPDIIEGLIDAHERTLEVLRIINENIANLLKANELIAKQLLDLRISQNNLLIGMAN